MFDILPSSSTPKSARRSRPSLRKASPPTVPKATAPRTIKLNWQLPARLRRPVKQEMARLKKRTKPQLPISAKNTSGFTRRPLVTPEPHTGDMHRTTQTSRLNMVPPYTGRFIYQPSSTAKPLPQKQPVLKKQITVPLQVNFSPGNTLPTKKKAQKGLNLLLFLVGSSTILIIASQLHTVSRGVAVLGSVEARAQTAYEKLGQAQVALASSNFKESEQDFADAGNQLRQAQQELNTALSVSRHILEVVDFSGTYVSATELLSAGEKLTLAGEAVSRGIAPLLNVQVLSPPDSAQPHSTMVTALSSAQVEFGQAVEALKTAQASLDKVDPNRLPDSIQLQVKELKTVVPTVTTALQSFLDQSSLLMSVLGADRDRQYLLAFQNNHEIRPTGGFIGSVAVVNISRGIVEDINVQSVYDPDGQLMERIAPPEPLRRITDRWFLRDANWFADYSVSARKIADFLEKEKGPTVDGVIAMTPEVVRQLLTVTGPITLPAYGVTVTPDNFVELTQDEVTYSYDRSVNRPKQFLADLTPVLLNKLFTSKEGSLKSLNILLRMITEKNLLLYFRDEAIQERIESAGWAGKLPQNAPALLSVNNANIGGHKSDQFIEQEIDYRLNVSDSFSTEAVVTIRRTHHGPQEQGQTQYPGGENPAFKDNVVWQRVFVPRGAELIEAQGFTSVNQVPRPLKQEETEGLVADPLLTEWQSRQHPHSSGTVIGQEGENDYFANWIVTKPGQTTVALYRYRLPGTIAQPSTFNLFEQFSVYVAKQPGDIRTTVRLELSLPTSVQIIHSVPVDGITQNEPHQLIYRGTLDRDSVVGIIYEKR